MVQEENERSDVNIKSINHPCWRKTPQKTNRTPPRKKLNLYRSKDFSSSSDLEVELQDKSFGFWKIR
jgi:hypothetical protein